LVIKVIKTRDYLRGSEEKITLRYDPDDVVKLPCFCNYDPVLSGPNGNEVLIIRKVEVQKEDGSWEPYPSVTWLDGVETEEQLVTKALVKQSKTGEVVVMVSPQGLPDGMLMEAAAEAGIHTELIESDY
jgi:hypothetical protein